MNLLKLPLTLSFSLMLSASLTLASAGFSPFAAAQDTPRAAGTASAPKSVEQAPLPSALTSQLMYEILLGEFSAQAGDNGDAYQLLLDAARKAQSPELYQRSMEIALRARAGDSALESAQAWARAFPASIEAHRFVLQILVGLNRVPDTADALKRAMSGLTLSDRADFLDQLPRNYARVADKKIALKAVESGLASELGKGKAAASAHAAIGALRIMSGDAAGALESARKGAAMDPSAVQPAELALALIDGRAPEAEALVVRHLQNAPKPEIRMLYIRKLLELQRFNDAHLQVDKLTASNPEFADGWLVKGSLQVQSKDHADAKASLERYLRLKGAAMAAPVDGGPSTADGAAANAAVASEDEESNDIEETPGHRGIVQAYFMLAQIAQQDGQISQARNYLNLITPPVDLLRLNIQRAILLAQEKKIEAARALIRSTPERSADDARAKLNAESQLLRDYQQFAAQYTLLSDALVRYPNDPDVLYDLAMVADKMGKTTEMEALLRQVIAVRPEYPHAYNALGYSLADRNERLPEARALVGKALELAPDDAYIADSMGWVEFRSGNLQAAQTILRAAFKKKHDAEIAAHLGEVLWNLDQQAEARAIFKQGADTDPANETLLETIKRLKAW